MNELKTWKLLHGAHEAPIDGGGCVMEIVSYVAGEKWSDHPKCACPVISEFLRLWNDSLPDDETRTRLLSPFVYRLVGTKATPEIERQRSFMALDWLVRVHTPAWLDLRPELQARAKALRSLRRIKDTETAIAAAKAVNAAWAAANAAAGDAALAAAGDAASGTAGGASAAAFLVAAGDAARDAAWAAAWDAVWAGDAAGAAAWNAAGVAAWAAARDAIQPTVVKLQRSASRLVDRMIGLTEVKEKRTSRDSAKGRPAMWAESRQG